MNGTRLLGQALGVLKDNVNVTVEQKADDHYLLASLAGDDPAKLAALREMLGAPDSFEPTRH